MRILKISAKNINSLKGDTTIDFEGSFGASALFAITGPTGAGKSTILDIISCALYARTARLQNPSELMSRNSGEAMCEVEFEIKAKRYRATWSQKRARGRHDGNLQPPKMELFDFDAEKIIESGVSKVPKKIEEICGLDFHRFTQSMMLAQGSFDAFLKANEKDRSALLEKITGTKIYAQISERVYERHKALQQKLEAEQAKLGMITLLDEEVLLEKQKAFAALGAQKEQLKKQLQTLSLQIQWYEQKERLEKEFVQAQAEFAEVRAQKEAAKEAFEKLEAATGARQVAPLYREKKALTQLQEQNKERLQNLYAQQKRLHKEKSAEEEALDRLNKRFDEESKEYRAQKEMLKEVRTLLNEELNLQKRWDETEQQYNEASETYARLCGDLEQSEADIAKQEEKLRADENYIQTHQEDASLIENFGLIEEMASRMEKLSETIQKKSHELQMLEEKLKKAQNDTTERDLYEKKTKALKESEVKLKSVQEDLFRLQEKVPQFHEDVQTYRELISAYETYREFAANITRKEAEIAQTKERLEAFFKEREQLEGRITLIKEKRELLQKEAENALLLQKYEADRQKLKEGEPCFLCGATEHPFAHESPEVSKPLEYETRLQQCETELQSLEKQYLELEKEISKTESRFKGAKEQLKEEQEALQKLEEKFTVAGLDLASLTYETLQRRKEKAVKELEAFEQSTQEREMLLKQKETLAQEVQTLQKALHEREKAVESDSQKLTHLQEEVANLQSEYEQLTQTLHEKLSVYGAAFVPDAAKKILQTLKGRLQRFKTHQEAYERGEKALHNAKVALVKEQTEKEELVKKRNTLEKELQTLQKVLEDVRTKRIKLLNVADVDLYEKELDEAFEKLRQNVQQKKELLASLDAHSIEVGKNIKTLESEVEEQTSKLKSVEKAFHEALAKEGFESEKAFEKAVLDEGAYQALQQRCQKIDLAYAGAKTVLQEREMKLQQHQNAPDKTDMKLSTLQQMHKEEENKLEALQVEEGSIAEVLKQDAKNRARYKAGAEVLDTLHKELAISGKLNTLIGSSDGAKFAKFAQGITLDQLIALANRHLKLLTRRYRLQRVREEKQLLELEIVDTYQGNITRSVNTLSGGESFLVSLALALGLSELASQKIKIDSLFLDEGFGTLDEESLEMALNALSILQDSGKMIGVISHVNALKERIPLQISVQPKGDGTSLVEVRG